MKTFPLILLAITTLLFHLYGMSTFAPCFDLRLRNRRTWPAGLLPTHCRTCKESAARESIGERIAWHGAAIVAELMHAQHTAARLHSRKMELSETLCRVKLWVGILGSRLTPYCLRMSVPRLKVVAVFLKVLANHSTRSLLSDWLKQRRINPDTGGGRVPTIWQTIQFKLKLME